MNLAEPIPASGFRLRVKRCFPHPMRGVCRWALQMALREATRFGAKRRLLGTDLTVSLAESLLLGNLATRLGQKLNWDRGNLKVVNSELAQKYVRPERRSGWEL